MGIVVACMGLTACGTSQSSRTAAARSASTARAARDGKPIRMHQLNACLQKNGVNSAGAPHSSSVMLERYDAALRKCRADVDLGGGFHQSGTARKRPGGGALHGSE